MLILLAFALQKAASTPIPPAGAAPEFQQSILAVEAQLGKGNFAAAGTLLKTLPTRTVRILWDDSAVPADRRREFLEARKSAVDRWNRRLANLTFKFVTSDADLKIDFQRLLPVPAGRSLPAPSVLLYSGKATPKLEAVIGLTRGIPAVPTTPIEIGNEVAYAIGGYFGVSPNPFIGTVMGRPDTSGQSPYEVGAIDSFVARSNLEITDALAKAVTDRTRMKPWHSEVFVDPKSVSEGAVTQGKQIGMTLQVTNNGNGPLSFRAYPDCGCITVSSATMLNPGQTTLIRANMDTSEISGDFNRRIIVASNDPNTPFLTIPVKVHIDPLYQFFGPEGNAVSLDQADREFDVYMALSDAAKLKPTQARIVGADGTVEITPWAGELADPAHGDDQPKPRKGYRFHVTMEPNGIVGKTWVNLEILTDDDHFTDLRYNLTVQKGIVAVPYQLYLGTLGTAARDFTLEVGRPQHGFKIEKIESDSPHLVGKNPVLKNWTYTITVAYDGKADSGVLKGTLKVYTNDPTQPVIEVPFRANVE